MPFIPKERIDKICKDWEKSSTPTLDVLNHLIEMKWEKTHEELEHMLANLSTGVDDSDVSGLRWRVEVDEDTSGHPSITWTFDFVADTTGSGGDDIHAHEGHDKSRCLGCQLEMEYAGVPRTRASVSIADDPHTDSVKATWHKLPGSRSRSHDDD